MKKNPKMFDCEQCGNPLFKSSTRDSVRCCYCGYVNYVGVFKPKNRKGSENNGNNNGTV